MRILHLQMQNFRQHADTDITFEAGLTGIIGPNGAGKSTILEGIAWALYGSEAARGTNETLRFARAAPRSRVEVALGFELGGHEYRVVRSLNSAEVFLDGSSTPVATTVGGVSRYLQGRLGMSRREFFNTYFTGQKELQFLSTMGPAERGRFLSQVLGYERLRQAQELARNRRNELRHEITGLRSALGDLDAIRAARADADRRLAEAQAAQAAAERETAEAAQAVGTLAPQWAEAELRRDQHRELAHAVQAAEADRAAARRDITRTETELARIAEAERELAQLRVQLEPLPSLAEQCERLGHLARLEERRRALVRQSNDLEAELARMRERLGGLEQAPELVKKLSRELNALRAEQKELVAQLDETKTAWTRDKQDAQTKLQGYREQGAELKEQIRQLKDLGPQGVCPTCARALGADFERVSEELEDRWIQIVQDGKWWKSRFEQLETRPAELAELEQRTQALALAIEEKARKHTRCEAAVQELQTARKEIGAKTEQHQRLAEDIRAIPAGYNPETHQAAEAQLRALRLLETRAARLEESAARHAGLEQERAEAHLRESAAVARSAAAAEQQTALEFSETGFADLRDRYQQAGERLRQAELQATAARGHVATAVQAGETAARDEAQFDERMREVELREDEFRHHNELDAALSQLRAELNDTLRPELSEIASDFLADLTDGRYTALEIDAAYNIMVLDEGEEKPVISGGEEDVANLVLRLSLSQMIAERAGHPLSLLILDEVFGSLDVARRDNVVHLLRRLENRFDQVILITHVEGIREGLDQVLRVEFDERTGSSVVRRESFRGTDDVLTEMAAD